MRQQRKHLVKPRAGAETTRSKVAAHFVHRPLMEGIEYPSHAPRRETSGYVAVVCARC
jgi:hypothetical protein